MAQYWLLFVNHLQCCALSDVRYAATRLWGKNTMKISADKVWIEMDQEKEVPHIHTALEILYLLSGSATVMRGKKSNPLLAEDFIVLNPWEPHWTFVKDGTHTLSFYISAEFLRDNKVENIDCCSCYCLEKRQYVEAIRNLLALLYKHIENETTQNTLTTTSYLYRLAALLNQEFGTGKSVNQPQGEDFHRLQHILAYTTAHYAEPITLTDVAKEMYLSSGYVSKKFQHYIGIPFSDYLRTLRLQHAVHLLTETSQPVGEIALNCGFANVNTFIQNFKTEYKSTPREYRHHPAAQMKRVDTKKTHSIARLLNYADSSSFSALEDGRETAKVEVVTNIESNVGAFWLCHRELMRVGMAESLLEEDVRNMIRKAQKEIGFRYITFYGLLSDVMNVYHEDADGIPWYSFTKVDQVLDFVCQTDLKPLLMLCFTPEQLCDNSVSKQGARLPKNLSKWAEFVTAFLFHIKERYGSAEISSWLYAPMTAVYVHYGKFSIEDYLQYYKCTFSAIRDCVPDACIIGGTLDTGFLRLENCKTLHRYLQFCIEHSCLPDIFSFQCLQCDYSHLKTEETEKRIIDAHQHDSDEPASVSADPNILKKEIHMVREVLDANGQKDKKVLLFGWNSTIWEGELSNDTCFKAACIVKNYLENMDELCAAAYVNLTDNFHREILFSNMFYGGFGLFSYQGVPKAGYYAYKMLNRMEQVLVKRGDGFVITRSGNKSRIAIMLYYYCHYNAAKHDTKAQTSAEKQTVDRYAEFQHHNNRNMLLSLTDLLPGNYQKVTYSISRHAGSSYDKWIQMGSPTSMRMEDLHYLSSMSLPMRCFQEIHVDENGILQLSALLQPHEVHLITLEKK